MSKSVFMDLVDEVLSEDMEIIDEFIEEEIKPLIDYRKQQEKKAFEALYKEVLNLEAKV